MNIRRVAAIEANFLTRSEVENFLIFSDRKNEFSETTANLKGLASFLNLVSKVLMTSAAKSFSPAIVQQSSSANDDSNRAMQVAQLLRTANLSDWQPGQADIQLLPSSCIENYNELVVYGKPLNLLATDPESENALPLNTKGMATRHQAGKLALRCRKLQVETAATGHPMQYKLYVAAGFVVHNVDGVKRRAPILLIPVSISRLRGRGSEYVLKYETNSLLRLNPHIAELCNTHVDQLIKPFETASDLRDYLRSLSRKFHSDLDCSISANTGIISLQADVLGEFSKEEIIDIELDRLKPGMEFQPLPVTPSAFDAQLALRILRFVDYSDLPAALANFSGQNTHARRTPILDAEPDLDDATLQKFYKCAGWLIDVGLGHWQLKNIAALPDRVAKMLTSINTLHESNVYQQHISEEFRTIDTLLRLNQIKDKILHCPPEMQHHGIAHHADADTRLLLQKAKIQASSIEQELREIHETFHMSEVPSSSTLHNLIKTISLREEESQLTNPAYFRARRKLNDILKTHHGVVTESDLAKLDSLAKTLRFAELFDEDYSYKRSFGSLFKGTNTNWQRLDSVLNYVRALSQDLGSSKLVAHFATDWETFESDFKIMAPALEPAASSAHQLCALIPMFINRTTSLVHATRSAEKFNQRVDQWQKYLRQNYADTELTPFQLLSNVDLGDHTHPTIALAQQDFDDRIYSHIVGCGLDAENVSATAEWLQNVIERLEIDIPTVRRFLDKEAELASKLS